MKVVLLTAGDPSSIPRTKPLISILGDAGHDVTVVSPKVSRTLPHVRHVQAEVSRRRRPWTRLLPRSDALAVAADACDPYVTYPLRSTDVKIAALMKRGFVLAQPSWAPPAERDFVWAGSRRQGIKGDWVVEHPNPHVDAKTTVHIVARFTATTPARYVANAFERIGVTVVRHNGSIDWEDVHEMSALVLFVESPYPSLGIHGRRKETVPVLYWVHHGEHHQPANLRLSQLYEADAVLMAHSWHLAHQYVAPVYAMPFAIPTEIVGPSVPFNSRDVDVSMVGAGMKAEGGWYTRRQERVKNIISSEAVRSVFSYGLSPKKMLAVYSNSRIVINDGGTQHFPITMRVFEAFGTGAALATDPAPGLDEMFMPVRHYRNLQTTSAEEIVELLSDSSVEAMASAGYHHGMNWHRYDHRVARILEISRDVDRAQPRNPYSQMGVLARIIDRDVQVQSVLVNGAPELAAELPDRDVRTYDSTVTHSDGVFDAVVIGRESLGAGIIRYARAYVYVAEGCLDIGAVRSGLSNWSETKTGSVLRFDKGSGGYRERPSAHPLS